MKSRKDVPFWFIKLKFNAKSLFVPQTFKFCPKLDYVYYAAAPIGKGTISFAFVRPSVSLSSVAYIANNSRTQRPSVPKFGRKLSHLRCDSYTSFKVKRSKIRVTRLAGPLMLTHRAPYLSNGKAYELQTTIRISHRRHGLQGQKLRS